MALQAATVHEIFIFALNNRNTGDDRGAKDE